MEQHTPGTLRGVIMDMDGTLVDSNDAHAEAFHRAIVEAGHEVSYEDVRMRVGMGGDNLVPDITPVEAETPEYEHLSERRKEIFQREYLPGLRAFPGVRALVERMQQDGFGIAIASSATEDDLKELLRIAGIEDLIDTATSSSDAESSKPDPDIVQAALKKLGLRPEETVMLGDTPYDIEAAGKAGVPVIALRCGGFPEDMLRGAIAIYDDPADLLAHYDQSPLGQANGAASSGAARG